MVTVDTLFILATVFIAAVALTAFEITEDRRRIREKSVSDQMRALSLAMTLGRRRRQRP